MQLEALWGLSNIAVHSEHAAGHIINNDSTVLQTAVSAMRSLSTGPRRESYFVIGNLINTASCQDLALLLDKYPDLLWTYVNEGFPSYLYDERTTFHFVDTIDSLL